MFQISKVCILFPSDESYPDFWAMVGVGTLLTDPQIMTSP